MQQVLDNLFKLIPELSPKLRVVAKLILDKPNSVATTSMRALAREAGVTPPTMIRLANRLGFERYVQFRRVFQNAVTNPDFDQQASLLQEAANLSGESALIGKLSESVQTNVKTFYQHVDLESLSNAADLMLDSASTYIAASGALHWIAAYMQYVGRMVVPHLRVPRVNGSPLVEGFYPISKSDIIFGISLHPYARQTIETIEYGISKGARFIYLTDSLAAPLSSKADILLFASTKSPQFFPSMVAVVAAIETLTAIIVARSGSKSITALSEIVEARKKFNIYIDN
ncbi:MAG: MurR/RpiR family transcriptional regulator [Desulfobulbaceae bacterium]|nr:MurR/RpiR family transcriptional regulator [Desulfobulbaceae bacterium]